MKILFCYPDFALNGGAEDYARRTIAVLGRLGHEVQVLDLPAALPRLVGPRTGRLLLPVLRRFSLLGHAIVCRAARTEALTADALIYGYGEGPVTNRPAVQILHAPALFSVRTKHLDAVGCSGRGRLFRHLKAANVHLARWIAGPSGVQGNLSVANSGWTAALSDGHPRVVYPPLRGSGTLGLDKVPGRVVSVGRLVRNKRHEDAILIVRRLQHAGQNVTLDIVGRGSRRDERRLIRAAAGTTGIRIFRNADPETLARAVGQAQVGLHCYRHEHFGIAVAEMIDAGVIPVVFDGGGVTELVPDPALRFTTLDEATDALGRALSLTASGRALMLRALQDTPALAAARDFDRHMSLALQDLLPRVT